MYFFYLCNYFFAHFINCFTFYFIFFNPLCLTFQIRSSSHSLKTFRFDYSQNLQIRFTHLWIQSPTVHLLHRVGCHGRALFESDHQLFIFFITWIEGCVGLSFSSWSRFVWIRHCICRIQHKLCQIRHIFCRIRYKLCQIRYCIVGSEFFFKKINLNLYVQKR